MKKVAFLSLALFALAALLSAQGTLSPSASIPKVDGAIDPGEYQYTTSVSGMTIGATLGNDGKLYLAVAARTAGWVALGLGNGRMDGSALFLAYDTGAKQDFSEQLGSGHSQGVPSKTVTEKWAVKASGGVTTLELVVPEDAAVSGGKVGLLYAYADTTSYAAHHRARGAMTLQVEQ